MVKDFYQGLEQLKTVSQRQVAQIREKGSIPEHAMPVVQEHLKVYDSIIHEGGMSAVLGLTMLASEASLIASLDSVETHQSSTLVLDKLMDALSQHMAEADPTVVMHALSYNALSPIPQNTETQIPVRLLDIMQQVSERAEKDVMTSYSVTAGENVTLNESLDRRFEGIIANLRGRYSGKPEYKTLNAVIEFHTKRMGIQPQTSNREI